MKIKNGLNSRENELTPPSGDKEILKKNMEREIEKIKQVGKTIGTLLQKIMDEEQMSLDDRAETLISLMILREWEDKAHEN